jgi:hypothetical protein
VKDEKDKKEKKDKKDKRRRKPLASFSHHMAFGQCVFLFPYLIPNGSTAVYIIS